MKTLKIHELLANIKEHEGKRFRVEFALMVIGQDVDNLNYIEDAEIIVKKGKLMFQQFEVYVSADAELEEIIKHWMPKFPKKHDHYYTINTGGYIEKLTNCTEGRTKYRYTVHNCFPYKLYSKQHLEKDHVSSFGIIKRLAYKFAVECCDGRWCSEEMIKNGDETGFNVFNDTEMGVWNVNQCDFDANVKWFAIIEDSQAFAKYLNDMNYNMWGEVRDE
jgi:hypothetical protein